MLQAMIQVSMADFLIPGDLNMRNDLEECQAGLLDCNCGVTMAVLQDVALPTIPPCLLKARDSTAGTVEQQTLEKH